ncbi:hypothetical protein BCR39DRAFT_600061 [Naematelia encephala]|uniref:Smr domain-containing protein n=1 Tax=Naematelia encephala TaxID=71784 RepID=A0A1Y2ATS2_9TREE|nr:hypothetical protein BCR39DRAFT_600061 [Naematelia encephala]
MGKPESNSKTKRLDFSLLADEENAEDGIDPSSLAAVLSADYPLIDNALIIALLSDYPPETIHRHVDEIRDQLGILEATIVPDSYDVQINESEVESTTDGDLEAKLDGLNIGSNGSGFVTPPSNGATSSSAKVSSKAEGSGSGSSDTKSTGLTSLHEDDGVEDELNLLTSLFPNTSTTTLKEALSSQCSVPAAIDYLLSLELIRDAEESGQWPDALLSEDETTGHSPLAVYSDKMPSISAPVSRSSSRRRKKDKHIVPVVDTLQRRAVSRPSSRTSSPSRAPLSRPTDNSWHTIASLAAYLSELIPSQPQSYFLAYFHAPDHHSAYAAARASLASLPQAASELEEGAEGVLNEIYAGYMLDQGMTEREKEAIEYDLKLCMNAARGDVVSVMDLMDLLDEISLWPGDEDAFARYDLASSIYHPAPQNRIPNGMAGSATPSSSTAGVPSKYANPDRLLARPKSKQPPPSTERIIPGSQPSTNHLIQTAHDDFGVPSSPVPSSPKPLAGKQIHSQNWRTVSHARQHLPRTLHPHASNIPAYSRGHLPNNPHPGSLFNSSSAVGPSIDDCLSRAAAERAKRELAIREAGRHFRGGSGGKAVSGAVAGHYAAQAREAMAKAREWELKAARMVVQGQMDRSGGTTVDLHHLTINEAVTISREAAQRWWKTQSDKHQGSNHQSRDKPLTVVPSRGLTIVTGVGRHSAGQRGVLGPAVANALEVDGWRIDRGETGRGYLVVKGKRS